MSVTLKYKIDNIEIFWSELMRFVDTNDAYTGDFILAPWDPHSDYVGVIKWGKFTIYQKSRYLINFLRPTVSLVIKGQIEKNVLSFKIRFPYLWYFIFNNLILTVFSWKMMTALSFKYGLILFIVTYIQTFVVYGLYLNRKQKFIERIEGIIKRINGDRNH